MYHYYYFFFSPEKKETVKNYYYLCVCLTLRHHTINHLCTQFPANRIRQIGLFTCCATNCGVNLDVE